MIEMPAWTTQAACAQGDPFDWHPEGTRSEVRHATARAKMVCAECPVRLKCLDWQLDFEGGVTRWNRSGIYGGMTPNERAALARGAA